MRILLYSVNYSPELTGVGKYSGEMARWFSEQGHDLKVVCAPPYYPEWKVSRGYSASRYRTELSDGILTYRCPIWVPRNPNGLKRLLHLISFAVSSAPVMLRQIAWRPDIILTVEPSFFCTFFALLVAKAAKSKSVLHIQDFEVDAAFDLGIIRGSRIKKFVLSCERFVLRCFDKVSTISAKMLERLQSKGVEESKSLYFPNWVDTDHIKPLSGENTYRSELNIPANTCVLFYSGNFGEKQGVEILVEAARKLTHYDDVQFVLCGSGSNYIHLKESSADLDNIKWLPLQEYGRLNELLNLADIHLLPQREDVADLVMPSKVTGMMASGRPVIATAKMGTELSDKVEGNGLVVPPGNVSEFVNAILELYQDKEKRASMGAQARALAEREWDADTVLVNFETELKQLVL